MQAFNKIKNSKSASFFFLFCRNSCSIFIYEIWTEWFKKLAMNILPPNLKIILKTKFFHSFGETLWLLFFSFKYHRYKLTHVYAWISHLFWANTIRFLDKTLATQHLTLQNGPKNAPQKCPQIWPKKWPKKLPSKITLKKTLIHAHKAQDRAEIKTIRYMKQVKTELLSSKLVQFSKQISNANISAPSIHYCHR